jgi:cell division protein FtsL
MYSKNSKKNAFVLEYQPYNYNYKMFRQILLEEQEQTILTLKVFPGKDIVFLKTMAATFLISFQGVYVKIDYTPIRAKLEKKNAGIQNKDQESIDEDNDPTPQVDTG